MVSPQRRRELAEVADLRERARTTFGGVRRAAFPIAQTAAAAGLAYFVVSNLLGHTDAFFAPVAAIITLLATRGQRVRQGIELTLGVAVGIGVGDLLIALIGVGAPQLALIVGMALVAAVVLTRPGSQLSSEAAVSATLVATVAAETQGFPPTRFIDALVGGAIALVFSQLLFPVHPVRVVRQAVESLLGDLAAALDETAESLENRDLEQAKRALVKSRRISNDWTVVERALDAGREAVRFAPPRRRLRSRFAKHQDVRLPLDLTVRDARMLARAAVRALTIGEEIPEQVPAAIRELARGTRALEREFAGAQKEEVEAREAALEATQRASSALPDGGEQISATVLVGHVQAASADMLRSIGIERDEAHAMVGHAVTDGGPDDDSDDRG